MQAWALDNIHLAKGWDDGDSIVLCQVCFRYGFVTETHNCIAKRFAGGAPPFMQICDKPSSQDIADSDSKVNLNWRSLCEFYVKSRITELPIGASRLKKYNADNKIATTEISASGTCDPVGYSKKKFDAACSKCAPPGKAYMMTDACWRAIYHDDFPFDFRHDCSKQCEAKRNLKRYFFFQTLKSNFSNFSHFGRFTFITKWQKKIVKRF